MKESASLANHIRFGDFEADLRTGELRKHGLKLKLQVQPFRILAMLLERPGELVTREEIREKLWPADTFIDFEHSVNSSIKKLREVLCDDAEKPRFIETLPRRGYRFIAPVEPLTPGPSPQGRGEKTIGESFPSPQERGKMNSDLQPSPQGRGEKTIGESFPSPQERGKMNSDLQPSPLGRGWPAGPGEGAVAPASPPAPAVAVIPPSPAQGPVTTGGFARRAIAAVVQAALEAHRARTHWRSLALLGMALLVLTLGLVMLIGLNVAGLRDRAWRAVRAIHESPPPKIESIAVLPLENLSRDPEQEYFADGMTDELIATLAKVGSLRVISRTSVMRYKGTKKPLPEIARELNVDGIVEGSVLRAGKRVRITAKLLHAPTDRHLWAESYESDLGDVLVLQGELARAIVDEIRIKVTPQEQARLVATRAVNPEAYQLYLKGRHLAETDTGREGFLKAVEYLQEAIQKDPGYPPTYATLVSCYDYLALNEYLPVRETQQKARALILKALELDNSFGEAHTDLGEEKLLHDWDWSGGLTELRRAVDLDPGNSFVLYHYGWGLMVVRRFDEAIPILERAIQLDPLSFANIVLAETLFSAHKNERALQHCQKMIYLDIHKAWACDGLGIVYEVTGRNEEAISAYLQGATLRGETAEKVQALRNAYNAGGIRGYWKKSLEYLEDRARHERIPPVQRAIMYTHAGEKEQAFRWLERAFQQHAPGLAFLNVDRSYDPLRSDPRFKDLLRRMNFPPSRQ